MRKAFLSIYHQIAAHLQRISDRAFRGVEADLPPQQQNAAAQAADAVVARFGIEAAPCGSRSRPDVMGRDGSMTTKHMSTSMSDFIRGFVVLLGGKQCSVGS